MIAKHALIFYYHRLNCYSFNALAGALDGDPSLADSRVTLATNADNLRAVTAAALKHHHRAIVALSVMTCQFEEMRRIIRQLRADCGEKVVVLAGGPHVTACAEEALDAGVDVAFRGEAELNFPGVIRSLFEGQAVHSLQSSPVRVDMDSFVSISPKRGMFGPIEITRGCAFACSYCQTSHIFGTKLRHRGIDNIVRQAASLRSGNRKVVRLLSPNAFSYGSNDGRQLNMKAMRELLSALRQTMTSKARILFAHFPSEARPEHITPDTLDMLKEFADNDEIVIGAQSGSSRMLEVCNRSHSVENVLTAVRLARKYGYKVIVDFIYGLPGETDEDMRESLKVMQEVVHLGARIHPHIFAPLPQTPFAKAEPGRIAPLFQQALNGFKSQKSIYEIPSRGSDRRKANSNNLLAQ
ncbi:MAG: TIGR04013 family B12-binding domain/radical SAM domain-containing protein [Acidobacteria bacterium]|nr:TIGR04013 family B12-binding domain/radical SAM domain-containing protein [Acidobacteriota bacterium]